MNQKTLDKMGSLVCLMISLMALSGGSAPLFFDGFEAYTNGAQLLSGKNGWGASDGSVTVQNQVALEGTNSMLMPPGVSATNGLLAGSGITNFWVEVVVQRVAIPGPCAGPAAVDTNAAVMVYLNTNNELVVYNPDPSVRDWVTRTNDAWGTNLNVFCTGSWARISLNQNYQTKKAAIFLEGRLIQDQWPFINANLSASGVRRFQLDSGVCVTSYVDNVTLSLDVPPVLANVDLDHDGIADAEEIQSYGGLTTWGATVSNTIALPIPNVILNGGLTVTGGVTLTVAASSLTVTGAINLTSGSMIVVTNGSLTANSLMIGVGATVQVFNATVVANGMSLTGTFTLDSSWGVVSLTPSRLNFADDFESHVAGMPLYLLGASGWATAYTNVIVAGGTGYTNGQGIATKGAELPPLTVLSNVLDTAQTASFTNIWTDCVINGADLMPNDWALGVDTAATAMVYINASKQLVVWNNGVWDICSNDVAGASASNIFTGGWVRVTLNQNYTRKDVAVFLNGRLMRQQVPFINHNQSHASTFRFESGRSQTSYLDNVTIQTNLLAALTGLRYDGNDNGMSDFEEIDRFGLLVHFPRGSVYTIR